MTLESPISPMKKNEFSARIQFKFFYRSSESDANIYCGIYILAQTIKVQSSIHLWDTLYENIQYGILSNRQKKKAEVDWGYLVQKK